MDWVAIYQLQMLVKAEYGKKFKYEKKKNPHRKKNQN